MKPENLQVLIPYKDLVALLDAAEQYKDLQADLKQLRKELDGVRCLIRETQDKCLEIERAL